MSAPVCDGTQNVERYRYRYFFPVPNIFDTGTGMSHSAMCNNKPALPVQRDKSLESQFGDIDVIDYVIVNQLVDKSFG